MTRAFTFYNGQHSPTCWSVHDDCAVSSAISYLTARIAHDAARVKLYRQAGGTSMSAELRDEAVALARQLMTENADRDWSRAG